MTPYPLAWPETMPRHKGSREAGQFRSSLSAALDNAKKSLNAFANDTGIAVSNVIFSSNVGGLMSAPPSDPGIALWFIWDGDQRCIAVDRYSKPEANLQAIHHLLEADRTKLRHGSLSIVRASYRGFAVALPAPGKRSWRAILGIPVGTVVTADVVDAAYRLAAQTAHPDKGGSSELMAEVNAARAAGKKEVA